MIWDDGGNKIKKFDFCLLQYIANNLIFLMKVGLHYNLK